MQKDMDVLRYNSQRVQTLTFEARKENNNGTNFRKKRGHQQKKPFGCDVVPLRSLEKNLFCCFVFILNRISALEVSFGRRN